MNRAEKIAAVEELSEKFRNAPNHIITAFSGLSVHESTELRRRVREVGGTYRVIKNRLAKRAAGGTHVEPLTDLLTGPRALVSHVEDPLALAKVLTEFASDHPQVEVIGGVIDAKEVVDATSVAALAKLPALPELRAQLLSLILMPATTLVRMIGTPSTRIAAVVNARKDKMESES